VGPQLLKRLKFPNKTVDRTIHLVAQHSGIPGPDTPDPQLRRWLRQVGRLYVWDLLRLRVADARAREMADGSLVRAIVALRGRVRAQLSAHVPLEVGDLAVGGADLRELGISPGPRYGQILDQLLELVTDDPALNERHALLARARSILE
jgi:tRNA nucleotidyltransferase (CCA-adding enzyme)